MKNRNPIDRLADIKSEIAALEKERDEIRVSIISGEIKPMGDEWFAKVSERDRRRITIADAERLCSPKLFDALVWRYKETWVVLKPRDL